jgi:hypothetical protein
MAKDFTPKKVGKLCPPFTAHPFPHFRPFDARYDRIDLVALPTTIFCSLDICCCLTRLLFRMDAVLKMASIKNL